MLIGSRWQVWRTSSHPSRCACGASQAIHNFVAAMLNLLWPLALARLLGRRGRLMRVVLALWVVGAWVVLLFTSSRAGWLGAIAAMVTLVWLWVAERGGSTWIGGFWRAIRSRPIATLTLTLFVSLVLAAAMGVAWRQLDHYTHLPILESRQRWWVPAWDAFLQRPWLGTGPYTYAASFWSHESVPPAGIFVHALQCLLASADRNRHCRRHCACCTLLPDDMACDQKLAQRCGF